MNETENSYIAKTAKIYNRVQLTEARLEDCVSVGDDTSIVRTVLERHVSVNRRNYINDSTIGAWSYTGIGTIINFAQIGKYCSIARNVDIGGFDHDFSKITTMPYFRYIQMNQGEGKLVVRPEFTGQCQIGNDVWIAAGAQVLHKANIGDGAVIGAGAVVTKDVPPYAIVAGVPGKIIGYRFNRKIISDLIQIRWWDWPEATVLENMRWFIGETVTEEVIEQLKTIRENLNREE